MAAAGCMLTRREIEDEIRAAESEVGIRVWRMSQNWLCFCLTLGVLER